MAITQAIILAAGYGTRFLPATKAMPKEMLPVLDKPVIQYVVEDAVAAGVTDIIIVTSSQKRAIEDHFDYSYELESALANGGQESLLAQVRKIAQLANFIYVRQKGRRGTLPAIQCGHKAIGSGAFLAIWGDDFFLATPSRCQQLVAAYEQYQSVILGLYETSDPAHTSRYGYVAGPEVASGVIRVEAIIEKPGVNRAPSSLAVVGGFVATPEFMERAAKIKPMANGEYGYAEVLEVMIRDGLPVYAVKIKGGVFCDCGNKFDYVRANIEVALRNPEMTAELMSYLKERTATAGYSGTAAVTPPMIGRRQRKRIA